MGIQKDYGAKIQPKIQIETPIGTIDTGDNSPYFDGMVIILVFFAFCFYVYAKYFRDTRWK